LLNNLYLLLKNKLWKAALRAFNLHSRGDHYERFSELINKMIHSAYVNRFVRDYILSCIKVGRNFWRCAVIGVDDEGYLFVHYLPGNLVDYVFKNTLTVNDIKLLMGFTHHWWEVNGFENNMRIRVQGDLVLEVLMVLSDTYSILLYLLLRLIESIVRDVCGFPEYRIVDPPYEVHIYGIDYLKEWLRPLLRETFRLALKRKKMQVLNYITDLTGMPYTLIENNCLLDKIIDEFVENAWKTFTYNERKLRFTLGNHIIYTYGIHMDALESRSIRIPGLERNSFIAIRRHTMRITHPEHEEREIIIQPGIYRIVTLNSDTLLSISQDERIWARIELLIELSNFINQRYIGNRNA